ncbi:MAG: hypothetical protein AAF787_07945, partial [Chloroflexota bacterium]
MGDSTELPRYIRVIKDGDAVEIQRRWYSHIVWILLPVAIIEIGAGILLWFTGQYLENARFGVLLFIVQGIGLIYWCFAMLANRTHFRVNENRLTVQSRPFPFRSSKYFHEDNIAAIYGKYETTSGNEHLVVVTLHEKFETVNGRKIVVKRHEEHTMVAIVRAEQA